MYLLQRYFEVNAIDVSDACVWGWLFPVGRVKGRKANSHVVKGESGLVSFAYDFNALIECVIF